MALVLSDRVKVRSTSTGTGAFALENAVQGFQDFSVIGDGNETFYGIVDALGNWEIGRGTYTASGNTLSRDQVLESSNNYNLVNFSGGSKNVFCTFPASLALQVLDFVSGSYSGEFVGNVRGSVFADDSTLLVDGTNGTIPYSVLSNTPTIPADVSDLTDTTDLIPTDISDLTDTGNLLSGGFSGSYNDLTNTPVIPADVSDLTDTTNLFFDRSYLSLTNTPVIPADVSDLTDTGNLLGGSGDGVVEGSIYKIDVAGDDSTVLVNSANSSINLDGTVKGDIIPDQDVAYDIGSPTYKFRDIYLSGSSINLGSAQITATGSAINLPVGSTVGGQGISGGGSGDGVVEGSIYKINIAGDDSTLLVDSDNGKIVGDVETARLRTAETKIALGLTAGATSQGAQAVAVGNQAGQISQGNTAVAIGSEAGRSLQGAQAVAIGYQTASVSQGGNAIAIGQNAGLTNQGIHAVAIGTDAGKTLQGNNSIIINATGATLDQTTANTFTVKPIRNAIGDYFLQYDPSTGEITYNNTLTTISADIIGSVFANNSTLLVDAVSGIVPAEVVSGTFTGNMIGNITGNVTGDTAGYHTGDVTGSVFGDDSTKIVDAVENKVFAEFFGNITGNVVGNAAGDHTGTFSGNVFSNLIDSADSSEINIVPSVNCNSNLTVGGDILPNTDLGGDLGSASQQWKSLFVSGSTIFIGGVAVSVENGALSVGGAVTQETLVSGTNIKTINGDSILGSGNLVIGGTVTSVSGTGTVDGLTLTGTVTSSGSLTLGGTLAIAATQVTSGTLAVARGGTGITSFGTGVATFLGTPSSANLAAAVTDETGTGALVFATSPTLVTPALGTPASGVLTNATGLPIGTGVSGLGTGVATALAINVGSAGAPVLFDGVLGTPQSGTVTNLTGTASININGTVGATTPAAGSFTTLNTSGQVVFNDAGADVDFRVEGDTNANLLFVDASADSVGIGNNQPTIVDGNTNTKLTVGDTTTNDGALGVITTARKGTSGNLSIGAFQFANTDIAGTEKRIAIVGGRTGTATNDGVIEFFTASSGTLGEVARFTQDKYLRFASGTGGIQFNGDTAAANALDDYEEGTWTPDVRTSSEDTFTTSSTNATYTKIGRQVFLSCSGTFTSTASTSASGFYIAGTFPFNVNASNVGTTGGVAFHTDGNADTVAGVAMQYNTNGTIISVGGLVNAGGSGVVRTFRANFTYFV